MRCIHASDGLAANQVTAVGIIANVPIATSASTPTKVTRNVSSSTVPVRFTDVTGVVHTFSPKLREYHPALTKTTTTTTPALTGWKPMVNLGVTPSIRVVPPDQDGDGLGDNPACDCDFEGNLAAVFMPNYGISTGEQQQSATYGDYVPWTVVNTVGTTPPNSYYHVSPLGLATDVNGTQVYAVRIDYLSLWNADGGLI